MGPIFCRGKTKTPGNSQGGKADIKAQNEINTQAIIETKDNLLINVPLPPIQQLPVIQNPNPQPQVGQFYKLDPDFLQKQQAEEFLKNQFAGPDQKFYQLLPEHQIILKENKIKTLKQLTDNFAVRTKIFNEVQQQQFMLECEYLPQQKAEPYGQMPYGNDGYTFSFQYQEKDIVQNSKKILVMGLKKSGKSGLINALANSFLIGYPDRFRYIIAQDDSNDQIQDCNLMEPDAKYQFFEVPGYVIDEDINKQIMESTYSYLMDKKIAIDMILLCRKNSNNALSKEERQIILNLVEIFGRDFIKKFQIINTYFDFGQRHKDKLERSLQEIANIYQLIPEPKISFVNSATTPKKGEEGKFYFNSVEEVRDNIVRIMTENQEQIVIRDQFLYSHRREIQENIKNTINAIKGKLSVLKPYLINYFSISQIDESDNTFMAEVIEWVTFNPEQHHDQYDMSEILQNVMLSDAILEEINQQAVQKVNKNLAPDQQIRKKQELVDLNTNIQKLLQVKQQFAKEKILRISEILELGRNYKNLREEFLEGTFWQVDQPIETLITKLMPDSLKLYLQQESQFSDPRLRDEFEDLRRQLFLPNNAFLATQILGGIL